MASRASSLSYDFLEQLYNDMEAVSGHPALAPAEQQKVRKAQRVVAHLCVLVHGEPPNAD